MTKFNAQLLAFSLSCALSTLGCTSMQQHATTSTADAAYEKFADEQLNQYLAWRPASGTGLGLHEYDGRVSDFSKSSIDAEHARLIACRDRLKAFDQSALSPRDSRGSRALLASLEAEIEGFDSFHEFTHNPMTYSSAIDLTTYAQRDFAPKPKRLQSVIAILKATPALLAAGKANLDEHLPKTFITTAIDQANGSADFINDDLAKAFEDVKDDSLQSQFTTARAGASKAMTDFATWLHDDRLPKADDNFAIGRDAYAHMINDSELIDRTPEQVLAIGLAELKREQAIFKQAAATIDPNRSPTEVGDDVQREHPTADDLIPDSRKRLEAVRQFVMTHNIVTFPSKVPVEVKETPKFERHDSSAMMDSPGPLDTTTQAFYYITPTEPEWDAKRKEEWLWQFNYYGTDVTTIHEAYPGHYVQFLHLRASHATRTEMAFGTYSYIEGWAHYCEKMVIDEGYPAGADTITRAKFRLQQSQNALLRDCRLCVAVQMHCQGMTVDQATKFFVDNCYMPEAPSREEANRGTFDPGYGAYTLGKLQILKLRDDVRAQEGSNFSLKKFNDAMLDNGQPPIRLLREMMLKDRTKWDQTL